jgi:hypothetical protein
MREFLRLFGGLCVLCYRWWMGESPKMTRPLSGRLSLGQVWSLKWKLTRVSTHVSTQFREQ